MLNKAIVIGRVVRDAELKNVNVNGEPTPRCRFSVAVNEDKRNGEKITTYFEVTAWREYATKIAPWIIQGRELCVEGNVRLNQYTSNNVIRTTLQLANPTVTFFGKKPDVEVTGIDELEEEIPFE